MTKVEIIFKEEEHAVVRYIIVAKAELLIEIEIEENKWGKINGNWY